MAHLLYITANPKPLNQSFSLASGQAFLDSYREANPSDQITPIDLFFTDIPLVDIDVLNGWDKLQKGNRFTELNVREQIKVTRINELCDQFISADKYVFVTPMWNLSLPPMTKAYIDSICIVGKTFKYTETGPVGLLNNKKALHIQARGGMYSEGPTQDFEFGDRYLKAILSFLGIQSIDSIIIEGMAQMPDRAENIKAEAIEKAKQLAKSF